jgi:hypothetical protein
VVHLLGLRRQDDGSLVADERGGGLQKNHRLIGHLALHLGSVLGIVAPDTQELAGAKGLGVTGNVNRHARPGASKKERQAAQRKRSLFPFFLFPFPRHPFFTRSGRTGAETKPAGTYSYKL